MFTYVVTARGIALLWVSVGIVAIAASIVACFVKIPAYVGGSAMVVESQSVEKEDVVVAVFLPPEYLSRLEEGQEIILHTNQREERLVRSAAVVEPQVISPRDARERFNIEGELPVTRPAAMAIASLKPLPDSASTASEHIGSTYQADMQVGFRRAISMFPLLDEPGGEISK